MIGGIVMIERGATPANIGRGHARVMRDSLGQTAAYYHIQFMAKHFTTAGAREYNYTPRAGQQSGLGSKAYFRSYTGRKARQKGHIRPLVWSGASELLARIRDVRATSKRARIVQHARGLNRRNPRSQVDMAREIRTVSQAEVVLVRTHFQGQYLNRIKAIRSTRRRRLA